jgi:hypothetical protein
VLYMTTTERIVDDTRDEQDACQRGTDGCCINHTAELQADRTAASDCETW